MVNGLEFNHEAVKTTRPDVPGETGFLYRFKPEPSLDRSENVVSVGCRSHIAERVTAEVKSEVWRKSTFGAFESVAWPVITGWAIDLQDMVSPIGLYGGEEKITDLRDVVVRSDLKNLLGSEGLVCFWIDLRHHSIFALPKGTVLSLRIGSVTLAESTLLDSPVITIEHEREQAHWLPFEQKAEVHPDGVSVEKAVSRLQFSSEQSFSTSWTQTFSDLGLGPLDMELVQRGGILASCEKSSPTVASLLAEQAADRMGIRASRFRDSALFGSDVLSSHSRRGSGPESALLANDSIPDASVAGLTEHASAIGANARWSVKLLNYLGLLRGTYGFLPERGGWNRDLSLEVLKPDARMNSSVLLHVPIGSIFPSLLAQPRLACAEKLIGYVVWELDVLHGSFNRGLRALDAIWVPSTFVADAVRRVTECPVIVTGHVVEEPNVTALSRVKFGIDEDSFLIHASFDANSTVARKNPVASIRAFQEAFGGDPSATLLIKIRNFRQVTTRAFEGCLESRELLRLLEETPGIKVVTTEYSHAAAKALIAMSDCYLSLHRSEGFGYSMAEAMASDTPTVATAYSGNLDFMDSTNSWLVPFDLVDVDPGAYFGWSRGMKWAEADIGVAAEHLVDIRDGSSSALRVQRAKDSIRARYSYASVAEAYADALRSL